MSNLPPLKEVDPTSLKEGFSETVELRFNKCKHELYAVSAIEARCKRCSVGYKGPNILSLIKASTKS